MLDLTATDQGSAGGGGQPWWSQARPTPGEGSEGEAFLLRPEQEGSFLGFSPLTTAQSTDSSVILPPNSDSVSETGSSHRINQ